VSHDASNCSDVTGDHVHRQCLGCDATRVERCLLARGFQLVAQRFYPSDRQTEPTGDLLGIGASVGRERDERGHVEVGQA